MVGSNNKDKGCYQSHIKSSNHLMFLKCILYVQKKTKKKTQVFLGGPVAENLPANAGDTGWIPGPGRSHMPGGR